MTPLSVADFAPFFQALWGRDPYPWQGRLVAQIAQTGRWPTHLDLPTGAGKTSALDIAVFLLALDAHRPPERQRFPRRVFLVVDRRTIVDQAFARAEALATKLGEATAGPVKAVADWLTTLAPDTPAPLSTTLLRGAMVRDDSWAQRPDQPLLGLSTVDQVGSRLLFRGYGVSDSMKPIHAGLLGRDCLYLLDEVHLAQPFAQTLGTLAAAPASPETGRGLQVARLSATHRAGPAAAPFTLADDDRATPALAARLRASKPITTALIDAKGDEAAATFAREIAARAQALARPGQTTGVIVNRVETARLVAEALPADAILITGRMRPLDRQDAERHLWPWVDPDRPREESGPPRFLVATQCVEAGADYDLDSLVTECAPIDALRQRVGRLNRTGRRLGARCTIVLRKDQQKAADPIYGDAMAETWAWLHRAGITDLGIDAFAPHQDTLPDALFSPAPDCPPLRAHHLSALAQTAPVPEPDPDISLFLHGPARPSIDVSVIWRADFDPAAPQDELLSRLELAPPGSLEALPLPISALRRWLDPNDRRAILLSDAGNAAEDEDDWRSKKPPQVFVWRGEDSGLVSLRELRPGQTILLPASQGGLRRGNFDPTAAEPVTDRGDEVQWRLRRRPTLRSHPALLAQHGLTAAPTCPNDGEEEAFAEALAAWLAAQTPAGWLAEIWPHLPKASPNLPQPGAPFTLIGRPTRGSTSDASTAPDTSAHTGVAIPLRRHLHGVAHWARLFAAAAGLPKSRVADLEEAGRLHDIGKADPRFQRWLHGGSAVRAALAPELLAKSATPSVNRAAREEARRRAGYPKGARHELLSLALLQADPSHTPATLDRGGDPELIAHLVASHHGHCRPFAPIEQDAAPLTITHEGRTARTDHGLARLDSGVSDRFWRLIDRYGPHGLAALEALLRLADHHRSALEQTDPNA